MLARSASFLAFLVLAGAGLMACSGDEDSSATGSEAVVFTVTFENTSAPGAVVTSDGASHDIAFGPGLWVVHGESTELFSPASPAGALEHLAEDGNPKPLFEQLKNEGDVSAIGTFQVLSGPTYAESPIMPGDTVEFDFEASPGDRLSMATMYGISNDVFVATPPAGIALFDGSVPLEADETTSFGFWDAGTEVNEEPGAGTSQPHSQAGPDTGPDEGGTVASIAGTDALGNSYPAPIDVLRVTVASK